MWEAFEAATRTLLASAEAVVRVRRDDRRVDFPGPAVEYAKAVETELNERLFPRLRRRLEEAARKDRATLGGRPLDMGTRMRHQCRGELSEAGVPLVRGPLREEVGSLRRLSAVGRGWRRCMTWVARARVRLNEGFGARGSSHPDLEPAAGIFGPAALRTSRVVLAR